MSGSDRRMPSISAASIAEARLLIRFALMHPSLCPAFQPLLRHRDGRASPSCPGLAVCRAIAYAPGRTERPPGVQQRRSKPGPVHRATPPARPSAQRWRCVHLCRRHCERDAAGSSSGDRATMRKSQAIVNSEDGQTDKQPDDSSCGPSQPKAIFARQRAPLRTSAEKLDRQRSQQSRLVSCPWVPCSQMPCPFRPSPPVSAGPASACQVSLPEPLARAGCRRHRQLSQPRQGRSPRKMTLPGLASSATRVPCGFCDEITRGCEKGHGGSGIC